MGNKVFSNVHNKNKFERKVSKDHGDKSKQWLHKNKKKNIKNSQQPQQVFILEFKVKVHVKYYSRIIEIFFSNFYKIQFKSIQNLYKTLSSFTQ